MNLSRLLYIGSNPKALSFIAKDVLSCARFYALSLSGDSRTELVSRIHADRLSYLSRGAMLDLYDAAVATVDRGIPGIFLEAGCALGGTALVLANARPISTPLHVYDTFDLIPEPSPKDGSDVEGRYEIIKMGYAKGIRGDRYYGYQNNLSDLVSATFLGYGFPIKSSGISLIKGRFNDTMKFDDNEKIAFAHIDCDWHDSVKTCLERIFPRLSIGGTIVIDDYHAWTGCRMAVNEFLSKNSDQIKQFVKSRLHLTKIS